MKTPPNASLLLHGLFSLPIKTMTQSPNLWGQSLSLYITFQLHFKKIFNVLQQNILIKPFLKIKVEGLDLAP